jgi:hypothetical protein
MEFVSTILGFGIFAVIAGLFLALLPGLIAFRRKHQYRWVIFLVGFFGSAFFVPWIAMIIWASWPHKASLVDPLIGSPTGLDNRNVGTVAGEVHNNFELTKSAANTSQSKAIKYGEIFDGETSIQNDGYKLFLLEKYALEKNSVLDAYIADKKIFKTLDEAFSYLHGLESERIAIRSETNETPQKDPNTINSRMLDNETKPMEAEEAERERQKHLELLATKKSARKAETSRKVFLWFLFGAIGIGLIWLADFYAKKGRVKDHNMITKMAYLDYRKDVLQSTWIPYVRKNEIKGWSRPYPEVQFCYEDVCTSHFRSSTDKTMVRVINYGICRKDGFHNDLRECKNQPERFEFIFRDQVVVKQEADKNFEAFVKQFVD